MRIAQVEREVRTGDSQRGLSQPAHETPSGVLADRPHAWFAPLSSGGLVSVLLLSPWLLGQT